MYRNWHRGRLTGIWNSATVVHDRLVVVSLGVVHALPAVFVLLFLY